MAVATPYGTSGGSGFGGILIGKTNQLAAYKACMMQKGYKPVR